MPHALEVLLGVDAALRHGGRQDAGRDVAVQVEVRRVGGDAVRSKHLAGGGKAGVQDVEAMSTILSPKEADAWLRAAQRQAMACSMLWHYA